MIVNEKLDALRKLMNEKNIQAYIVMTDDFHSSEYVGSYFKVREYLSGFTGSAGTLVVLKNEAALWTDGRYFIQAEEQLKGGSIDLMKSGQPDVPDIIEYLYNKLNDGDTIGFDGRTVSNAFASKLIEALRDKSITLSYQVDLADELWTDRPPLSREPVWELDVKYTGLSRKEKLKSIREKMAETGADILLLTALDEIAWILNLRGNDIACTPVFLAYMIIEKSSATLCVHKEILNDEIIHQLENDGISLADYNDFYSLISEADNDKIVQLDGSTANYCVIKSIPESTKIIDSQSPVVMMKAIKTPAEMNNIRAAHIKDGVAVTRFIYWLKHNTGTENITELSAAEKLEQFRAENDSYLGPSFEPIIAYGAHGAIVHYEPTEETNVKIEPKGLCLTDTGGHYLEGTTDITRTIALGRLTDEEKTAFTLVLKGHLNLAAAKFKYGICGENLDYLARYPLWSHGLDYNHSTGHGVGCLLSVHEGPQRIHWNVNSNQNHYVLEEGMIISNEPGYYLENHFGIRHENLVLVRKGKKNSYGQFMYLENLTMVPFDRDAIDPSLLNSAELGWLNEYHKKVFDTISPYLNGDELEWLKKTTEKIV
ncbi:MAG: aminopeptidase P family protein [Eubacterium sp.]|nr:aminopeptidase P family protein [Eubacterium sp.]